MRSLETAICFAAIIFALGMVVIASSAPHLVSVESPSARMQMAEEH